MAVDDQFEVSFLISQETLPRQPILWALSTIELQQDTFGDTRQISATYEVVHVGSMGAG